MMKADDALSGKEGEWGGAREKRWEEDGKRAVVMVDGNLYTLVTMLAGFCRRPAKSLNQQIYAAGLAVLFGHDLATLEDEEVTVMRPKRAKGSVVTDEQVRAVAQEAFSFGDDA
jgi:hypothetical protein